VPLYLRKSVSVGPFRFNLSKSGVGVSTGVKGLRFGAGPRGNYVHVGRGGLYYRRTLAQPTGTPAARPEALDLTPTTSSVGPMREIDSGDVAQMVDGSSADLVKEITHKLSMASLLPVALGASALSLVVIVSASIPSWTFLVWGLVSLALGIAARYRDITAKSVVVLYNLDPDVAGAYEKLIDCLAKVSSSSKLWHIPQSATILDTKYHGGATTSVRRKPVSARKGSLPVLKANVDFPVMPAGAQLLVFTPERLLVFDRNKAGAVSYSDVRVDVAEVRFLEEQEVPSDTKVIDRTWRYVNKKGGPDRRFKDNPEIPVVVYEEIHLTSPTGLNELFQASKLGTGAPLAGAIQALSAKLHEGKPA